MGSLEESDKLAQESQDRHGGRRRVSLDDLKAKVKSVHYFRAGEAAAIEVSESETAFLSQEDFETLNLSTFCVILTTNGYSVHGHSAPADATNFDEALGRQFAYDDALRKLWPLEGYLLREELSHRPESE